MDEVLKMYAMSADDNAEPDVDHRNRKEVIGNVLLNLMADGDRALFVAQGWHDPHEFLQEEVA